MSGKRFANLVISVGLISTGAVYYMRLIRPWHLRRGATAEEVGQPLPGDQLVPAPRWGYQQAITIAAPPPWVWPWLVQTGYGRAGWYTFDWFYELTGAGNFVDGKSSDRIVPELQALRVGDRILIHRQAGFTVVDVDAPHRLILHTAIDLDTGQSIPSGEALPKRFMNMSWGYYLQPAGTRETRLHVRVRCDASPSLANRLMFGAFIEGGSLIMQPKMLQGIKERAERSAGTGQHA